MTDAALLRAGDRVQLSGPKGKLYTFTLVTGESFHTNRGALRHDDMIGQPEGCVVSSVAGSKYLVLRPLLEDFVMSMPRGAAIIYPKDAAQILALGDIYPGATVVEAGVGSGAMSLWLLRAIGTSGSLHSFERRAEFASIARSNAVLFYGHEPEQWHVHLGDLVTELDATLPAGSVDRVVLDMLAPWECVEACATALRPGGVIVVYVATVTQLSRVTEALRSSGRFTDPKASETLVRDWHVEGLAVRPEHRMVGHSGFLLTARLLAPGTVLPRLSRRPPKDDFSDDDVELWTPDALGDRSQQGKRLRKTARRAEREAELRNDSAE